MKNGWGRATRINSGGLFPKRNTLGRWRNCSKSTSNSYATGPISTKLYCVSSLPLREPERCRGLKTRISPYRPTHLLLAVLEFVFPSINSACRGIAQTARSLRASRRRGFVPALRCHVLHPLRPHYFQLVTRSRLDSPVGGTVRTNTWRRRRAFLRRDEASALGSW